MTSQKSFKRQVRARMAETHESYTTARRRLMAGGAEPSSGGPAIGAADPAEERVATEVEAGDPPAATVDSVAGPAGAGRMSEEAVAASTGRGWAEWFALLDAWDASTRKHPEIARWLAAEHAVSRWWSQTITVAYERARGTRAPLQRPDGLFSITASKTVDVPVGRLFDAFLDTGVREQWLPGASIVFTTVVPAKTLRGRWGDGSTRLAIGFTAKGAARSQVALAHERLVDDAMAKETQAFWAERMVVLTRLLGARPGG